MRPTIRGGDFFRSARTRTLQEKWIAASEKEGVIPYNEMSEVGYRVTDRRGIEMREKNNSHDMPSMKES
jgi:hypothetical protein